METHTSISNAPAGVSFPGAAPRLAAVEVLRMTGCVGICMFHALAPWPRHILPGSEVFMALTIAFATRSAGKVGFAELVKKRFMSLFVTWLIWCWLYAVLNSIRAYRDGRPPLSWFESPHMLVAGSIWELWFPPFAFAATVLTALWITTLGTRGTAGDWRRSSLILAVVSGALLIGCASLHGSWLVEDDQPYHEWLRMLPAAVFGAAMGRIPFATPASVKPAAWAGASLLLGAAVATFLGWDEIPSRYFATAILISIAWCTPVLAPRWLLFFSQLTFGVYLVHMGAILVYYKLDAMFDLPSDPWTRGIAITIASFCVVPIFRYTPLRWMVGVWGRKRIATDPSPTVLVGGRSAAGVAR